ncbi:MAG: hypothetical protein ACP5NL_01365 [Thermoplasmata archaeon]
MYNNTNQKLSRVVQDCILYIKKYSNWDLPARVSDVNVRAPAIKKLSYIVKDKELINSKHGLTANTEHGKSVNMNIILYHDLHKIFFSRSGITFMEAYKEICNSDKLAKTVLIMSLSCE